MIRAERGHPLSQEDYGLAVHAITRMIAQWWDVNYLSLTLPFSPRALANSARRVNTG